MLPKRHAERFRCPTRPEKWSPPGRTDSCAAPPRPAHGMSEFWIRQVSKKSLPIFEEVAPHLRSSERRLPEEPTIFHIFGPTNGYVIPLLLLRNPNPPSPGLLRDHLQITPSLDAALFQFRFARAPRSTTLCLAEKLQ